MKRESSKVSAPLPQIRESTGATTKARIRISFGSKPLPVVDATAMECVVLRGKKTARRFPELPEWRLDKT
jgi:hypothetical protein